jgi:protein SCO1/2
MKNNTTIRLFVILVFVIPVIAYLTINWYEKKFSDLPVLGPVKNAGGQNIQHTISEFSLYSQDNRSVTLDEWNDKIVVANFFFTHCPVVCPAMVKQLKKVQDVFIDDPNILITSFSVDPERDSVAQFAARMGVLDTNWLLLTGEKKQIYRLARNSFLVVATDGDGGPTDFIHSEKLVLIDRQKRIRGYYQGTNEKEVEQLIIDIKKLKDED